MPTNLNIDDSLLKEAVKLGSFKTKREAVNSALQAFIKSIRRKNILKLSGKVDFYPDYDHKKLRSRR